MLGPLERGEALNESPSEKEGKLPTCLAAGAVMTSLNESPSEKEGKYGCTRCATTLAMPLNESPSEKEGKFDRSGIPRSAG